jgi:integral membrane protein
MMSMPLMSMNAALLRYRVMAYAVGIGLAVLVFIGIPLQVAGYNQVVAIVGPIHGVLYIVYLICALDLARRAKFSLLEFLAMVGAGLIPILAFVVEHYTTKRVRREMAQGVPERKFFLARTASKEPPA